MPDTKTPPPDDADIRLATYGTLAPGRVNHHQLAALPGRWLEGTATGRLVEAGWGAKLGYPGLVLDLAGLDPAAGAVAGHLFESPELPGHWPRLDSFEGEGYRRVAAPVWTDEGPLAAWIYVIDVAGE